VSQFFLRITRIVSIRRSNCRIKDSNIGIVIEMFKIKMNNIFVKYIYVIKICIKGTIIIQTCMFYFRVK